MEDGTASIADGALWRRPLGGQIRREAVIIVVILVLDHDHEGIDGPFVGKEEVGAGGGWAEARCLADTLVGAAFSGLRVGVIRVDKQDENKAAE